MKTFPLDYFGAASSTPLSNLVNGSVTRKDRARAFKDLAQFLSIAGQNKEREAFSFIGICSDNIGGLHLVFLKNLDQVAIGGPVVATTEVSSMLVLKNELTRTRAQRDRAEKLIDNACKLSIEGEEVQLSDLLTQARMDIDMRRSADGEPLLGELK